MPIASVLMPAPKRLWAMGFALGLHALVLLLLLDGLGVPVSSPPPATAQVVRLSLLPPPSPPPLPLLTPPARTATTPIPAATAPPSSRVITPEATPQPKAADPARASMAAPPPPTPEEWAFAARYTLKNSKGYRHSWSQQVRSMMGTAVEGPDQGHVRFRIEIAPDGSLASLQTLWTTSAVAEQLARQAIRNMPPSPPTPTGKPLIFEKTIAFSPFATDGPPLYKDDCLPDPPAFRNPFAWDGRSPQMVAAAAPVAPLDPDALADCLRQLPQDSIEAEAAHDQRQLEQWGSSRLKP